MLLAIPFVSRSTRYTSPDPWQAVKNFLLTVPLFYKSIRWTSPDPWPLLGYQGVTNTTRCRLTNSALVIRVQCGGSCGVSANEYSCAHHVTWSPNKLWRSTFIFNLCWIPFVNQAYSKATHNSKNISPLCQFYEAKVDIYGRRHSPTRWNHPLTRVYFRQKN